MSTQRNVPGGKLGQSSEFELDLANTQGVGSAPDGQSGSTPSTQQSEVPYTMVQGAGGLGQTNNGQPSIFGGGGPAFTQMAAYTPVAPGAEQPAAPHAPYPPQAAAQPAAPLPPTAQPAAAPGQLAPQAAQPMPQALAAQGPVQAQAPMPAPAAPAFQAPQGQPQAFDPSQQQFQPQPPQPMAAPEPAPVMPPQEMPDLSAADPGFPDSIFPDFNATPPAGADPVPADAGFPDPSFVDQSVADAGAAEANFASQGSDASFPETNFAAGPDMGHRETVVAAAVEAQAQMPQPQAFAPQAPQAPQTQAAPPTETGRQLLAFDAEFANQPPEIALGGPQAPAPAQMPVPQEEFDAQGAEADFVDESLVAPAAGRSKFASLKGRSAFMVGSALLGAIALGGALAFAYKESGGGMGSGEQPPIVAADASPVKAAPADPGGKEFPHKNKLIYDRLTNGDVAESERIVPRQEDVAVPAMPPATATAGLPTPVASTDLSNPAAGEEGGPRKVKTLVVRPDGSVEAPPAAAAAAVQTAAAPAAAAPKPATTPPAANAKYVVQVGSKKSQTDALAAFADIQQKHPKLLANYRPIVQKANLGTKGTWYRLRVGPIDNKADAYKLCGDLKSQGLPDCLVMTQ